MICPNKTCKQEIPDNSIYCDQCGLHILYCTKCGSSGTSKFCGKCGGNMAYKESADSPKPEQKPVTNAPNITTAAPAPEPELKITNAPPVQTAPAATVIVQLPTKKLLFCHTDGWNMEISAGDILGRTNGNHTDKLGGINVISGTHAQISYENKTWLITDMRSTNKTFVGGMPIQPGIPTPVKNNDIVQLANVKFIVREV